MNTNILISSDEEKYINDILDKGISDIISTNPNPNLLKSSLINVEHSYLNTEKKPKPATGSLLEDTSNSNVLIKSNALRQLLDEMKSNNNYITSSEDEMEKRIRFGNLKLKKYSELDKIKEQEGIDRSLDENPLRNQMNTNMKIEITSLKDKIESLQDKLSNIFSNLQLRTANLLMGKADLGKVKHTKKEKMFRMMK